CSAFSVVLASPLEQIGTISEGSNRAGGCLDLFVKVVFRKAKGDETARLMKCFELIPDLQESVAELTTGNQSDDFEDFATGCFADFIKIIRGKAAPKQLNRMSTCGWNLLRITHELHKVDERRVVIPSMNDDARIKRNAVRSDKFAFDCVSTFKQAVFGRKTQINAVVLAECGKSLIQEAKKSIDRYVEMIKLEDSSVKMSVIDKNLDATEDAAKKCLGHFVRVMSGTDNAQEGSLVYCGGVIVTTTRLFVDIATGKNPMAEENI
ncbi:hypothetical protein PFISCL1PPCAC_4057, partial [Pristionchus fissidentatus]